MTREEILKDIGYKGKYNKEVKTKLNKLLKKYHPDNNKDDKKTILVLYEVKKDLETGKVLDYNREIKNNENDYVNSTNTFFIERIIKILKHRRNFIKRELNKLYKRSYYYINKIYEESYDKGLIDIKIDELNNNINYVKRIDIIEILILLFILIIIFIGIITGKYILIVFIIIPILFELYYLNSKKIYINDTIKLIKKLKAKRNEYIKREEEYNENIKEIRKHEVELEKEIKSINNDIAYYNNELNKVNNKQYNKEKSKTK